MAVASIWERPSRLAVCALAVALSACDQRRSVILLADSGNYRILQMEDMAGTGLVAFAYPAVNRTLVAPVALAVDSKGRIYASNFGDDAVTRMDDITGEGLVSFGRAGSGVGQFNGPSGIALDSQDHLYVADSGNNRIVRIDDIDGSGWTTYGRKQFGIRPGTFDLIWSVAGLYGTGVEFFDHTWKPDDVVKVK